MIKTTNQTNKGTHIFISINMGARLQNTVSIPTVRDRAHAGPAKLCKRLESSNLHLQGWIPGAQDGEIQSETDILWFHSSVVAKQSKPKD